MGADRQKLNHGGLVEADPLGLVDKLLRQAQVFGHAAVAVDAQHLDVAAAVGLALAAGVAVAAGHVGHDVDRVTARESAARRRLLDDAGKLVSHHARVGQVRLVT
jgi:hypothetical protein